MLLCMTMAGHRRCALLLTLLLTAALAAEASAAGERVVAVLYFDNNTGDPELDVLKKGLADMMITDLAAVSGIVVVERDRLQALLAEIELHKSAYIDKRTAIRLGKGLGAQYAVTGAFQAVKPTLRIDMRMIEIATGKVVASAQVRGHERELFELTQRLVARFVAALAVEASPGGRSRTRVPDVDTLIEYSRGVDQADQGKYADASQTMARVVKRAPAFALARIQHDQILQRLAAASARRADIQADQGAALARSVEDFLRRHELARLSQDQARHYIAYRVMRGRFILRQLGAYLSEGGVRVIRAGSEARARSLLKAYRDNMERLIQELALYARAYTTTDPRGHSHLDTRFELPPADLERARAAGVNHRFTAETSNPRVVLAEFLLLGYGHDGSSRFIMAPPLAALERASARRGYQLLAEAFAAADADAATRPHRQLTAIGILDTHAEALLLFGEHDKAIAKLQEILDRYPTSPQFARYEKRIKEELGLVHNDRVKRLERYAQGLSTCNDMDLRVGLGVIVARRLRLAGLAAVDQTVAEIEARCQGNPRARSFWAYLYSSAALRGGEHGDCQRFDAYMKRFLDAGGSRSDAAGYRRNYSQCPAPGAP